MQFEGLATESSCWTQIIFAFIFARDKEKQVMFLSIGSLLKCTQQLELGWAGPEPAAENSED